MYLLSFLLRLIAHRAANEISEPALHLGQLGLEVLIRFLQASNIGIQRVVRGDQLILQLGLGKGERYESATTDWRLRATGRHRASQSGATAADTRVRFALLSHLWAQHEHLAHCLIRLGLVGQLANLVQAEHVLALLLLLLLLLEHRLREARASLSVS